MSMELESTLLVSRLIKNLPDDQFRLLLSILLTFPIGIINHFINGENFRLIYSFIFGVIFQYYMYGLSSLHVMLCGGSVLLLINFCDRKTVGWSVTYYCFFHLSVLHVYRMIYDYAGWGWDVSSIMMMSLCKFTSFAFCYSDGDEENTKIKSQNKFREKSQIRKFTILEFFSYIYFYPTCIAGPFFEFSDFREFINRTGNYTDIPVFSAFIHGIRKLCIGFICAGFFLTVKPFISVDYYFEHRNFIYFVGFLFIKYKFYTGFMFTESVCTVSGISFRRRISDSTTQNEYDFEKVKQVNISVTEFTMNINKFFQNWNMSVHNWLKPYIYFRIYDNPEDYKIKGKVMKARVITFMISALWHGFYPSYYIVFSQFSIAIIVLDNFDYIKKNIIRNNFYILIFDVVTYIYNLLSVCYVIGIVECLSITKAFRFMYSFYFLPTILILLLAFLTSKFIAFHKARILNKTNKEE